jgi:protein DPCD
MEKRIARTCIIAGGIRRLHSTYPDGFETVEEFNINNHELISRKVKKPSEIGEGKWEYEVGDPPKSFNPDTDLIAASSLNVI